MYVNDSTQSILFYRFMFKKEGTNTWAIVIDQLKTMVPSSFIQNWYLWFIKMGFSFLYIIQLIFIFINIQTLIWLLSLKNKKTRDNFFRWVFFYKMVSGRHILLIFNCIMIVGDDDSEISSDSFLQFTSLHQIIFFLALSIKLSRRRSFSYPKPVIIIVIVRIRILPSFDIAFVNISLERGSVFIPIPEFP